MIRSPSTKNSIRFSYVSGATGLVFVFLGSFLWIATLFVESLPVAETLTKTGCALYALACAILSAAQVYLFTNYIGDVKELLKSSERTLKEVSSSNGGLVV